jgi:hypothetical protein
METDRFARIPAFWDEKTLLFKQVVRIFFSSLGLFEFCFRLYGFYIHNLREYAFVRVIFVPLIVIHIRPLFLFFHLCEGFLEGTKKAPKEREVIVF